MPLKDSVEREHLHTRSVECFGFRRSDGLWDVEAHLLDTKTYDFANEHRGGRIEAGEALHRMGLRVTLDLDFMIHDIEAVSDDTPFGVCNGAEQAMKRLVGLTIGPGWMSRVKKRIESNQGCTHLVELLGPLATTAYQTLHPEIERRANAAPSRSRPRILDTCIALSTKGEVVKEHWPQFYAGPGGVDEKREADGAPEDTLSPPGREG